MTDITKPARKGRNDGQCEYLSSDYARFLVMRGDYSEADIIQASVEQNAIDAEGAQDFASSARYYQCWYKVSPIGGQEGYSGWHHPRDTPCRGAYFASVLQWD
ncbi:TPA: hypothetical protein ACS624_002981 [Klebsiella michiganensis]|uniref:hypothetical protein n=1 Tax=Raoultella terrigena TaxID=577 RepID=UPI0010E68529|nr:hypothetical protein [Raoultella terrigena]EMB3264495.1 hypothetical protein [Klebsiella michiganensis]MDU4160328.1 hypothetical protein [Klebsiella michiganensis]WJV37348.1 hypothetical protein QVN03_18305 [Raoultella terrigena]VTM86722.1 Uncharacterised protein [Raoultella ornithinolytica]